MTGQRSEDALSFQGRVCSTDAPLFPVLYASLRSIMLSALSVLLTLVLSSSKSYTVVSLGSFYSCTETVKKRTRIGLKLN